MQKRDRKPLNNTMTRKGQNDHPLDNGSTNNKERGKYTPRLARGDANLPGPERQNNEGLGSMKEKWEPNIVNKVFELFGFNLVSYDQPRSLPRGQKQGLYGSLKTKEPTYVHMFAAFRGFVFVLFVLLFIPTHHNVRKVNL